MADGSQRTPGTGEWIATDEITDGGVANGQKAQRVKVGLGADNHYKDVLPPGDGADPSVVLPAGAMLYNDATGKFDPARPALEGTALAPSSRTASTFSPTITLTNHRGMIAWLVVSVSAGTTLTLTLYGLGPSGNQFQLVANTGVGVSAVGWWGFMFYPGATAPAIGASGAIQQVAPIALPRSVQLRVLHGDANPNTYSVSYSLIP